MSFAYAGNFDGDECFICCRKCKGLFLNRELHLHHVQECTGSPYKSPCQLFACERKYFLQVLQQIEEKETLEIDSCIHKEITNCTFVTISQTELPKECTFVSNSELPLQNDSAYVPTSESGMQKDCSFVSGPQSGLSDHCSFVSNADSSLPKNCTFVSVPDTDLPKECTFVTVSQSGLQKDCTFVPVPGPELGKDCTFESKAQQGLEKDCAFVSDPDLPAALQNLTSPPTIPSLSSSYPCIPSELLGSSTLTQDDTSGHLLTNIEECRQLQYLDLAKKDPFLCQGQPPTLNSKDPFLINASVKLPVAKNPTRSSEDLQTSPTFQDSGLFTFPSSNLDEPTQLDYLDLATIDLYMGNSTLGNYGSVFFKPLERVPLDKDGNYNADELDQNYNCGLVETSVGPTGDHVYEAFSDTLTSDVIETSAVQPVEEKGIKKRKTRTTAVRKRRKSEGGNVPKKPTKVTYNQKVLNMKDKLVNMKEEEKKDYVTILDESGRLAIKKVKLDKSANNEPKVLDDNMMFKVEKIAGRSLHTCKECDYKSYYRSNMERHQSVHKEKATEKCPHCDFGSCSEKMMKVHMERHEKQNLCYVCGERFPDCSALTNHLAKHTGAYRYKCPECEYCTNLKSGFEDHQRKHAGHFLHCDYENCDFKTIYRRVLNQHKQKHEGLKKHICDQCGFHTGDVGILKKHMAASHQNDKNFKCPHCDYLCVARYGVVQHIRSKHYKVKQYKCDQCEYRTGYSSGLRFHLMAHAGIKPFKCSACSYHSSAVAKVTRHMKKMHIDLNNVFVEKLDLPFQLDAKRFKCDTEVLDASEIDVIELTEEDKKELAKNRKNTDDKSEKFGDEKQEKVVAKKIMETTQKQGEIETVVEQSDIDPRELVDTIKMPGPSGTLVDFVLAYQCRRCLLLYTKLADLYSHIDDCKSTPLSEIVDVQI